MFTHEGYEFGFDARMPDNYKRKVILRETKTLWISKCGKRYSKKRNGRVSGVWPLVYLELSTIKKIEH